MDWPRLYIYQYALHLQLNFLFFLTILINCTLNRYMFSDCWKMMQILRSQNLDRSDMPVLALYIFSFYVPSRKFANTYEPSVPLYVRHPSFVTFNSIVIPEQFGFKPKHSTRHHLCRVTKLLHEVSMKKETTGTVFLDTAKAFVRV